MPTLQEEFEKAKWLISKGRGSEPAKLVLPRIEAQRRKQNKEQRSRFQFDCTPTGYSVLHTEKERIMQVLGNNPTLFETWLGDVMQSWSDEMVSRWVEAHERAGE